MAQLLYSANGAGSGIIRPVARPVSVSTGASGNFPGVGAMPPAISPIRFQGPPTPAPAPTPAPIRSIGPAYNGPSGTIYGGGAGASTGAFDSTSGAPMATQSSLSALSNLPWYVWAVLALAIVYVFAQPRELRIKA